MSLQLEIVNLPPFDLEGEHYERTSLVDKDLLVREWGGNLVAQYLQSGRLRVAHPDAPSYRDNEMFGHHASLIVSNGVEAFGPGVGNRIHEQLRPTEAPAGVPAGAGPAGDEDDVFDPFEHTAPDVKAYVEAHPGEATAVLSQELTGKARKGLVAWLQEQVGETADLGDPDDPDGDDEDDDDDDDLLPPAAEDDDDFVVAKD